MSAIPGNSRNDTSTYTPPPVTDNLRPGETLEQFAARHQVTPEAVRSANPDLFEQVNQTQEAVLIDESRLLRNETLVVPESPMSVTGEPLSSDFNPGYSTSNDEFGFGGDVGNGTGGVVWNPGDGVIKVSGGQVYSTENAGAPGATDAPGGTSPVVFEVRKETAVATGARNDNGNTVVTVEIDVSRSAGASAEAGQLEGEASVGAGFRGRYQVVLPGENRDPGEALSVNPFDPTTIPVGGSVTMHGAAYTSSELAGSFRHIGTRTNVTEAAGASYTVARTGENSIQVTMGPDQAIEVFNGVGLRFDAAELMLGRADNLGSTTLRTAEFDLSTPSGQASYANFVGTGEVAEGSGISNVATIERIDYNSQTRLEAELGPLSASIGGAENVFSLVHTTYPDGSYAVTTGVQYSGNVPLTITQRFDAAGNELDAERTYSFEVSTDHDVSYSWFDRNVLGRDEAAGEASLELNHAQLLNSALTGEYQSGEGPVQAGQTVTITFSEAQMQALMGDTRATIASNGDGGVGFRDLQHLVGGSDGRPPATSQDFAIGMARNLGSDDWGFTDRLLTISEGADGDFVNDSHEPIEAEVTPAP